MLVTVRETYPTSGKISSSPGVLVSAATLLRDSGSPIFWTLEMVISEEGAEREWGTAYVLRDSQGKAPLATLRRTYQWNHAL